jgi:hypothetical protein
MKISTLAAITLLGAGLIGDAAVAANFGVVTLAAGKRQTVDIGYTGRMMRVCNDFFSSGRVVVTIGANFAHDLIPGVCAEDIGDRMTLQSLASGFATVEFRPLSDVPGHKIKQVHARIKQVHAR